VRVQAIGRSLLDAARTRRLGLVLALGALALAVLLTGSSGDEKWSCPPTNQARSSDEFFGVNAPLLRDYAGPDRAGALDALSCGISAAGISWARVVFGQVVEERQPGKTDWTIPDRVVGALARHGVRTQALFVGTAAWAADPSAVPVCGQRAFPADVAAWSRFVGAAVERYGRGGAFWAEHREIQPLPIETWEIGNEENLRLFWCPAANPERYAAVYRSSRAAALAADAKALVVVGGLAPTFGEPAPAGDVTVPDFLQRMVRAEPELAREIPAVAIHPYSPTPDLVLEAVRAFREAMTAAGLGQTPMIANEVGWYTDGPPGSRFASQGERAERIRELTGAIRRTNCNLTGFGIHSWVTAETDSDDPEDWYGLADPDTGEPNESGRAYGEAIADAGSGAARPTSPFDRLCG
jgi:hypothetical protein